MGGEKGKEKSREKVGAPNLFQILPKWAIPMPNKGLYQDFKPKDHFKN